MCNFTHFRHCKLCIFTHFRHLWVLEHIPNMKAGQVCKTNPLVE